MRLQVSNMSIKKKDEQAKGGILWHLTKTSEKWPWGIWTICLMMLVGELGFNTWEPIWQYHTNASFT